MSCEDSPTALPKPGVLSHGLTLLTTPGTHHSVSAASVLSKLLSAGTIPRSVGVFLILLPSLFSWKVKAIRKESRCLLFPPNQILFFHWHDGVLPKKYPFFMFGFFYGLKKPTVPSFLLSPCTLLCWLKWVDCL